MVHCHTSLHRQVGENHSHTHTSLSLVYFHCFGLYLKVEVIGVQQSREQKHSVIYQCSLDTSCLCHTHTYTHTLNSHWALQLCTPRTCTQMEAHMPRRSSRNLNSHCYSGRWCCVLTVTGEVGRQRKRSGNIRDADEGFPLKIPAELVMVALNSLVTLALTKVLF